MSKSSLVRGRLRRGAYLLPSLFTIGNITLGFYAIALAYRGTPGDLRIAAILIFIAAILDALDGRVARMTGTDSDFGREFDSLADVLTFGAAPAWISYLAVLHEHGRIGWLVPALYVVCTAARLARFNVQTKVVDSRWFVGLPSPAAACALATVFFANREDYFPAWVPAFLLVLMPVFAALELSTFRYPSFKRFDLRRRWSYRSALPMAVALIVLLANPRWIFPAIAIVYTSWGIVTWGFGKLRRHDGPKEQGPDGGTNKSVFGDVAVADGLSDSQAESEAEARTDPAGDEDPLDQTMRIR